MYLAEAQELIFNENVLLQRLGFDVSVLVRVKCLAVTAGR
jgi:hypothetical protein